MSPRRSLCSRHACCNQSLGGDQVDVPRGTLTGPVHSVGSTDNTEDLIEAIVRGEVRWVRAKPLTVFAALMGLLPIVWSTGTGADLMKRVGAPMVGGFATSFILELLVYQATNLLGVPHGPASEAFQAV